jgi:hypothetical protein
MNNTLHTPAPWKIATFDGPHEYASIEAGDGISEVVRVCDIPNWPCAIEEMQANARLISAAPDLLSAVDSCLEIMIRAIGERLPIQKGTECEETDWQTAIRNAREALRKAKGEA